MSPDATSRSTTGQECSSLDCNPGIKKDFSVKLELSVSHSTATGNTHSPFTPQQDCSASNRRDQHNMASPFACAMQGSSSMCANALKSGSSGGRAAEHNVNMIANRSCLLSRACDKMQCLSPRLLRHSDKRSQMTSSSVEPIVLPQELSQRLDHFSQQMQVQQSHFCRQHSHPMILVDIRPFLAFSRRHISGALNVNCASRFSCRRLKEGKLSLVDLVTSEEGKQEFQRRLEDGKEVVVYDEDTQGMDNLPNNHPTSLVIRTLRKEGVNVRLLKGGMKEFLNHSEGLCVSELTNANSSTTSLQPTSTTADEPPSPTSDSEHILRGGGCPTEGIPMTQILPHLYVGNEVDAANLDELRQHGIGYVLNATNTVPCFHEGESAMHYLRIPVRDNGLINLRCHFQSAYEFIEEARRRNARVLVHCHAGISRSSTITIAYVMKHMNQSMTQAYQFVKSKRPIIAPNLGFVGQLMEFEQGLKLAALRAANRISDTPANCAKQLHQSRPSTPSMELDTGLSEA